MTLSVDAYYTAPNGSNFAIHLDSNLAGVESARHQFYGSATSLELGLMLLPHLKDFAVLTVQGSNLQDLLIEVETLLATLPQDEQGDYWRFRLNNIRTAVERARNYGEAGFVSIG